MPRVFLRLLVACLLLAGMLVDNSVGVAARQDASDAAWAAIRAKVPADQPLYRPTWLPDRFRQPGQAVDDAMQFGVRYVSDAGETMLFGRTGNVGSCLDEDRRSEPVLVHGLRGTLTLPLGRGGSGCLLKVAWEEQGELQLILTYQDGPAGISREELLQIVAGLAAVTPSGAPLPTSPLNGRADVACFRATSQCMAGPFRAYWEANGGLALNGYPLTGEMPEQLEDGRTYQVQYFERVRLEFHPENADSPYEVLLGQFGRRILAGVPGAPTAPVPSQAGSTYFAETGHNVGPRFGAYWRANGGLAQFGYPLTELFEERLEDGKTYQVQYFERARFELHPENAAPNDVQLGQFGRRMLSEGTPNTLVIEPASGPCPAAGTAVAARGGGFTPGVVTRFTIRRDLDGEITGGNSLAGGKPANADGTYTNTIPLIGCGPADPPGSTFTVTVTEYTPDRAPANGQSASATFTVTAP